VLRNAGPLGATLGERVTEPRSKTKERGRAARWLASPRLPTLSVVIACLLALPALRVGLAADDLWHRATLRHDTSWIPTRGGPLDLFRFADGTVEENLNLLERGFLPWWTLPGLRMVFFRPLSSLTHAVDYALWPSSPVAMHAHSIAWYAVVVVLAGWLYRRWLGPISPLAAGIATLFYAIDPPHGLPIGWLANRNALVAAAFGFGGLLLHDLGASASRRARAMPFAAAASFGLALCAGESAAGALAFLFAHVCFLDPRPRRERIRSLVPTAAVVVVWFVVYRVGRYGATGSGVYTDPIRSTGAYLQGVFAHVPLLLGVELGGPTPEVYPFLGPSARLGLVAVALAVVAFAGFVVVRLLRANDERVRRVSRFFVVGSLLAILPSAATFPSGRLVLIAGLGLIGLVALACASPLESGGRPVRSVRWFAAWMWLAHLVLAPVLFVANLHSTELLDGVIRRFAMGVPTDGSAKDKRLVVVNAPDTAFAYYALIVHLDAGRPAPERMLVMASCRRDLRVSRTGDRTFTVQESGGFYRLGSELLFRTLKPPFPVGTSVVLSDVTVTITHTTGDGVPDEASFVFTKDLETGYVFREWKGKDMVPFALPAIGETVTFPARLPNLF
jgi:hypothetical protein